MKNILFLIVLALFSLANNVTSQNISEEEKQRILSDLDSADYMIRWGALEEIIFYDIEDAVPKLEDIIWLQEPGLQVTILQILRTYNSAKTYEYTLAFLDSVDNYSYENSTLKPLDLKIEVLHILFQYNDFSKIDYVFEIIERDRPNINVYTRLLLADIIRKVPEYADRAKAELLNLAMNENANADDRYSALSILNDLYGSEILPEIKETFIYNPDVPTRMMAMKFLFQHNYSELNSLLRERLPLDPDPTVRYFIAEALLDSFSTITNYTFVKKHQKMETDSTVSFALWSDLYVYKPARSESTISTLIMLDTLTSYTNQCYNYEWLKDEAYKNDLLNKLTDAKNKLTAGDSTGCRTEMAAFQNSVNQVYQDSAGSYPKYVSDAGYKFMYHYAQYILDRLPEAQEVEGLPVKLQDSQGNLLQGGSLQYYDGGWQDAIDNGDGTFTVQTERTTVSLKIHYAGGSQQRDNVTVGADTAVFQTSDVIVKLLSSQNTLLDSGLVQYYAGGWQDFGTLVNGVVHKELLSKNYNFKMKYAGSEKNIVQNLDTNTTVTFQTVNAEVQLKDSQGNFLDGGTAEYYANGWKPFGTLTNGKANKELLSRAYTFKMHYANAENNLVQNLDTNTTVVFNTVNATVQLKDSQDNLLDGGVVQYYAGGWLDFGTATNGAATKELLPKSYNFKMQYGGTDKNIVQDLSTNTTITFNTVNTEIQLRDSQGNLLDGGFAKYYANGWKDFGSATNGIAHKELLSRAYTFKIQYGGADINHVQNLDTNTTVVFSTISVTVQLKDSQGNLLDSGTVEYYAAGWKPFGEISNGETTKELLSQNYTFKMLLGGLNTTRQQDVSTNNTVNFSTTLTTIKVKDNQNQPVENAEVLYYGGGWEQIGNTNASGEVTTELLARSITFKAKKGTTQQNKQQDTSTNSVVEIILE